MILVCYLGMPLALHIIMNATNPGSISARAKGPKKIDLWDDSLNHGRTFPWFAPVTVTGELVQLAAAIQGAGGSDLIHEIEGAK